MKATTSQASIARQAGISAAYLSQIKTGDRVAPWGVAKALAEVLGIDPAIIADGRTEDIQRAINAALGRE